MLKKVLLVHALIEIVGAIFLLFKPTLFIDPEQFDIATGGVLRMYAIAILIIAAVSLQCYKFFSHSAMIRIITISFVAFHLLIGMQLSTMYRSGSILMIAPSYFHLALGFIIAIFYYQEKENFLATNS